MSVRHFIAVTFFVLAGHAAKAQTTFCAEVGPSSVVRRVVVAPDAQAASAEAYCGGLLGGTWKQTYTTGTPRGQYARPSGWYDASVDQFKASVSVAVIGDSIVANMSAVAATQPAPFNTAQYLGVSGNTVAQIQARIGSISASATHVVIEGGTNDLFGLGSGSNIIPGYTAMLNALTPKRVIILGIPQTDAALLAANWPGGVALLTNANIAAYNAQLTTLCNSYPNCTVADRVMQMNMTGKTNDGIHPQNATYIEISTRLSASF